MGWGSLPVFMDHTCISSWYAVFYDVCLFFVFVFFNFILLYNTVLVLPYTDLDQPRVYMSSQSWTPLPFACFLVGFYFSHCVRLLALLALTRLSPIPTSSSELNSVEQGRTRPCKSPLPFLPKWKWTFRLPFRCELAEVCCCWWAVAGCVVFIPFCLLSFQFLLIEILSAVESRESPKYPSYNEHNLSAHC